MIVGAALLQLLNERILLPLGESRVGALEGALQLRHLRGRVGDLVDADRAAAARPQLNRDTRIVHNNDSRMSLLGADLEDAVLEVAVVDGAVVKEPEVGARGLQVVNETERERAESKTADADRLGAALNASDRGVDDKAAVRGPPGDEGKDAFEDAHQRRALRGLGAELFVERECRVGRKPKPGAVGKRESDKAVRAGLDDIAVENAIAGANPHHAAVRPRDIHLAVDAVNAAEG